MVISTEHIKNFASEKEQALKHLEQLCLKSIKELRDIPELEQPTEEQQEFIKRKIWRNDNKQ
jgi:hypothetical protein